ncbi:hypothetical protein F3Y22_tig00113725pilonHSYRG00834 [Hibiscus syriacus]|uniref:P-type ATPase A domain-containing protein n=1 Tax=Hibiscus syriacus TaxID=106335 RepID=A0A6A2X052_HIBSY|nr:hypothetical protein F3Y22_tig00113725pilonHSYRG00834 [Hibiscus syriacus]
MPTPPFIVPRDRIGTLLALGGMSLWDPDLHKEGDALKIDQFSLIGESLPITKDPGDEVFSGSTDKKSEIEVVVLDTGVHTFFCMAAHLADNTSNALAAIGNLCICSIVVGMVIEIMLEWTVGGVGSLLALLPCCATGKFWKVLKFSGEAWATTEALRTLGFGISQIRFGYGLDSGPVILVLVVLNIKNGSGLDSIVNEL